MGGARRGGALLRGLALSAGLALALACGGAEKDEEPAGEAGGGEAATEAPAEPTPEAGTAAPEAAAGEAGAGEAISASAMQEAERIFSTRCATCHGPEGRGDGPASKGLDPQPRNFHLEEWQQSVTDEHIERIIMYGGAAVGKSPAMPANPDLTGRPEVVGALRAHIRELGES